ncbi:alcohol dehydrogenase catalytic domain-containing protein [Nakamurella flava]|uniref:alcohol dehydrogenase catalytic domain-containing protein n=1 Tax=Nakamurella flava TaxID=2576308 RepID=UPI001F0DEC09|nr:alcohol dehydrogenase catalytic domain-containing protein [Nakamurella flava]
MHDGRGGVRVAEVPDAELLDPGDAVVRVRRAAVCGTDLHVLAHHDGLPAGTTLGHEFVGEVVAVGAAVSAHWVGDLVAGADFSACGTCWWCRRGHHWECPERRFFGTGTTFGPALAGAQAELVRVPFADATLQAVPSGVSADRAVFLGDTLATGYAAVRRTGAQPGDTVAVLGGGPVGQLCSLVAQACGAGVVLLVEPVEARRALAAQEGAVAVEPDRARAVLDGLTDGRGADAVVDAVGGRVGLDMAFGLVRRAGTVVSVGVPASTEWAMPVERAFVDELTVGFAVGNYLRDGAPVGALVRSGLVDPLALGPLTVGLDEAPEAYRAMIDRRTLKTLIAF